LVSGYLYGKATHLSRQTCARDIAKRSRRSCRRSIKR